MRKVVFTVLVGLVTLFGSALTASAAPAPSSTLILVCSRSVTYTDPFDAPSAQVTLFGANGQVGASAYVACPSGGGRVRTSVATTGKATSATVRCWNGFIQSGDHSGSLALRGSCVDSAGTYGTFASFTVR